MACSTLSSSSPKALASLFLPSLSLKTWLTSIARSSFHGLLPETIIQGKLTIIDSFGSASYGNGPEIVLTVYDDGFYLRLLRSGDVGFSEAFILGEIAISSLSGAMHLWLDNHTMSTALTSLFTKAASLTSSITSSFIGQSRANARLNVIASYDQSNDLFRAFLSEEMMYSCALWSDNEGGVSGDFPNGTDPSHLHSAQMHKIQHVLSQLVIPENGRILEYGSGWGGLAITAALTYPSVTIDTLTLSIEQKTLSDERIRALGLENRITVHLMDYRDVINVPEWKGAFDGFVSIEMVEHVGPPHYPLYFHTIDYALKPLPHCRAIVSASSFPEGRFRYRQPEDFMRRYMWPNSALPSPTVLINAATGTPSVHSGDCGALARFSLSSVENHSKHYPRTLREWGYRLDASLRHSPLVAQTNTHFTSLLCDRPEVPFSADSPANRKWVYLFAYAAAGFEKGWISCHMFVFARDGDSDLRHM